MWAKVMAVAVAIVDYLASWAALLIVFVCWLLDNNMNFLYWMSE